MKKKDNDLFVANISQDFNNYVKSRVEKAERKNILIRLGDEYSNEYFLLKYENHDTEVLACNDFRINRNTYTRAFPLIFAGAKNKLKKIEETRYREWRKYQGNIYGAHCLQFKKDEEFGIYLPSSSGRDVFITLATEDIDGKILRRDIDIEIIAGDQIIGGYLGEITRPNYFKSVIVPFLDDRPTAYHLPRWKKRLFFRTNRFKLLERYEKAVKELFHGSFVYVGCKEEVYLLAVAKGGDNGRTYMQGMYVTSVKPIFYFSNNYLRNISRFDVDFYNKWRDTHYNGSHFIFPQMGRSQNCNKNTIFTGEPDIITGDVEEALEHFKITDFAEFSDIVRMYAKKIEEVHPSSGKPNGRYYYY